MPLVSIITPLYNGTKTLDETAASILNQDFPDWEWILFDDGSNDGSQELGKSYSEKYPDKIFYYEHSENRNYGTAYTRNRAAEKSAGKVISFIDQDDVWYENRLSEQLNIFNQFDECAMIWGPALYWYKEREFKQPVGYKGSGLKSGMYNPPDFVEIFLSDLRGTPLPSASLVRRKYFNAVKGYEESIRGSEDIVLWLKLADKYPIYYHDEILIKYRKHQDSTLRIAKQSGIMDEWDLGFYNWVIEFLKRTSAKKELIEDSEFTFYNCLKRIAGKKNYFESRSELLSRLRDYPDFKKKFMKDFFLDLILPFDIATKVSAKVRFEWFKNKR